MYKFWDIIEFSFIDEDLDLIHWYWKLRAKNVNFNWDFWIDIIDYYDDSTSSLYNDLSIKQKEIIRKVDKNWKPLII